MSDKQQGKHQEDDLRIHGYGDDFFVETGPQEPEAAEPLLPKFREMVRSLLEKRKKRSDVFDAAGSAEWDKVFKLINPNGKTRTEIFPKGTGKMEEQSIIKFIVSNYSDFIQGGVDPSEFPEFFDEELRPLMNAIAHTSWIHPLDGSAGHLINEKGIAYSQAFIRVLLDLEKPSANKFISEAEDMKAEWMQKYPNLEISMHRDKIVGDKKNPRIISYGIKMDVKAPEGVDKENYLKSDKCHNISSSFFAELNKRIAAMQN